MKAPEYFDRQAEEDVEESEDIKCKFCSALVYWGPYYDARGDFDRRLFSTLTRRLHDCRVKLDPNAFDVVPT